MSKEKITYNYCMGTGCHEVCILTTHVQDGKVVFAEETSDPNSGHWLNGICQKGVEYVKFPYLDHPTRLNIHLSGLENGVKASSNGFLGIKPIKKLEKTSQNSGREWTRSRAGQRFCL